MIAKYFWNNLIAFDQMVNTVFGGDPDETISSRLGKYMAPKMGSTCGPCRWFATIICRGLDMLDEKHCHNAIEWDEGKDGLA